VEPVMLAAPVKPRNVTPEQRRAEGLKRRQLERKNLLERVMSREGPEFSEAKYNRYRARKIVGITFAVLGGSAAMVAGMWAAFAIMSSGGDEVDEEEEGEEKVNKYLGRPWQQATCLTLAITGLAAISFGVPFAVSGTKGMKRQNVLRSKEEILKPFQPAVKLSILWDPAHDTGGLVLRADF
jgi:hypothetical protein